MTIVCQNCHYFLTNIDSLQEINPQLHFKEYILLINNNNYYFQCNLKYSNDSILSQDSHTFMCLYKNIMCYQCETIIGILYLTVNENILQFQNKHLIIKSKIKIQKANEIIKQDNFPQELQYFIEDQKRKNIKGRIENQYEIQERKNNINLINELIQISRIDYKLGCMLKAQKEQVKDLIKRIMTLENEI